MSAAARLVPEVDARTYNRLIVEAVTGVLADFAPRALTTTEVQRAFAPRNIQRVYNALRKLERAERAVHYHEVGRSWWAAERFGCSTCSRPADRVIVQQARGEDGEWVPVAYYACRDRRCAIAFWSDADWAGLAWRPNFASYGACYVDNEQAVAEGFVA
jgi:hypothetical protein